MLRRKAVVDGDDGGGEFESEAAAVAVERLGVGGEEHEPAAVEVDDDGEILSGDGGFSREEEAEPEVQEAQEATVNGAVKAGTASQTMFKMVK